MSNKLKQIAKDSAKGGFYLFLGDASSKAVLAVGSILIARLLKPEGYGLYTLALVVPALLSSFITFGIGQALIRFPAKLRAEGKDEAAVRILRSGLTFRLLIGAAMSAVGFLFSDFFATYVLNRPDMGFYVRLASLAILFQAVFGLMYKIFVGLDRMERSALLKAVMSATKSFSAPLLIVLGFGVAGAVLGHVLGYMVAGVVGLLLFFIGPYKTLRSPSGNHDNHFLGDLKLMLSYGFPLYISSLLSIFLSQYKLIILAFCVSNFEIGNFNVATNLITLLNILIFPISITLFPAFSKLDPVVERAELKSFFNYSVKYASLFVVPASVAVMALSKDIVNVVYGPAYKLASLFLLLCVVPFLFIGLYSRVLQSLFNGLGETKLTLKTSLINLAAFIPLAPLLTQLYGVLGMIFTLTISNLLSVIYGLFLARQRFGIFFNHASLLKIYIASSLSALPLLLFLHLSPFGSLLNLAFGVALFLFTYLTLAPVLRVVQTHDIKNLRLMFGELKFVQTILKPVLDYEVKLIDFAFKGRRLRPHTSPSSD